MFFLPPFSQIKCPKLGYVIGIFLCIEWMDIKTSIKKNVIHNRSIHIYFEFFMLYISRFYTL